SETELTALLTRLSQKSSVQSVLILSRETGGIIRALGTSHLKPVGASGVDGGIMGEVEAVKEYAGIVWRFVKMTEEVVGGGGGEGGEELRLVRVRTRRGELVIVPAVIGFVIRWWVSGLSTNRRFTADPKYILVVIHDTPAK
ncbi:hypothetical protein BDZ91DRAFT_646991, partial [Kalaharituber pfeilii]